jgi:hypothetical protein
VFFGLSQLGVFLESIILHAAGQDEVGKVLPIRHKIVFNFFSWLLAHNEGFLH